MTGVWIGWTNKSDGKGIEEIGGKGIGKDKEVINERKKGMKI
jgi:hypothetical protein